MDKNTITGLVLIFLLIVLWQNFFSPTPEPVVNTPESTETPFNNEDAKVLQEPTQNTDPKEILNSEIDLRDSLVEEEIVILENEVLRIEFSTLGGIIKNATLKKFEKKLTIDEVEQTSLVSLLGDSDNSFDYTFSTPKGLIHTKNQNFSIISQSDTEVSFGIPSNNGYLFIQKYTLNSDYLLDYSIQGGDEINGAIQLEWTNYIDRIEENTRVERNYVTINYKPLDSSPKSCSTMGDDQEDADELPIKWIAQTNQFFNTSFIARDRIEKANMVINTLDEEDEHLKRFDLSMQFSNSGSHNFQFYIGPNEFERLYELGYGLQEIIPFGWSFFGSINRWIIRPIFNFLSSLIGSKGIVILILTLIVKAILFPLTYKMLYSQSKMGALKPQIEQLKAKFKNDPQQQQVETMKMYREFGVNPLGGCLPMLAQMPIWFALYRFFPASIEFRQAPFLWATDLSSYDVITRLPFEVPFGFGSHLSLFTLLWAITTLIYTYYNTKDMDMSANPAMKYMQYIMPLFFLGFFNSYASGLTAYLLFSNVINIGQTIVTKKFVIDHDKIKNQLEANKAKPKKKSGFQARLENALKEQQKIQAQRAKGKK
jgi:YidC/Oxa1 family membrane protein insertase